MAESQNWTSDTFIYWIVFGVVLGFTAVFFVLYINSTGVRMDQIKQGVESHSLIDMMLRSGNCMSYGNGITQYGIIDYSKFTEPRLDGCTSGLDGEDVAFRIALKFDENEFQEDKIKTSNWNDNIGVERRLSKDAVIAKDGKSYNGKMSIEMQNYKE